jgi:hypothetical protein
VNIRRSFHVRSSLEHNRSNDVVSVFKVCPDVRRPNTTTTIASFRRFIQRKFFKTTDYHLKLNKIDINNVLMCNKPVVVFGQHNPCCPIDEYLFLLFVDQSRD